MKIKLTIEAELEADSNDYPVFTQAAVQSIETQNLTELGIDEYLTLFPIDSINWTLRVEGE